MKVDELPTPVLVKTFNKFCGGSNRTFGIFVCHFCNSEFQSRMGRIKKMTGLCRACSNRRAGRIRARFPEGAARGRLHETWMNMKRRCLNPQGKEKRIYHGVSLCDEWMDYGCFMDWALKNGYTETNTIDRKDLNLGYSPDNCRFTDYSTQNANRGITSKHVSGYIGVSFQSGAWRATVVWRHKQINIGRFKNIDDAAIARNDYIIANSLPHTLNEIRELERLLR